MTLSLLRLPSPSRRSLLITRHSKAFTLLEMLLAISVFALIAVVIGGAMRVGYRSQEKGERKMEATERLRRTADLLQGQIESSLPLTYDEGGETKSYFAGDHKTLTLATNYSLWEGRKGYVIATYSIRTEPSGKESLSISEQTIGTTIKNEAVLLADCDLLEFTYLEKGLTLHEDEWVDGWTNPNESPDRIRVKLKVHGGEYSLSFPLRVKAKA